MAVGEVTGISIFVTSHDRTNSKRCEMVAQTDYVARWYRVGIQY